jgi:hypothetical protein
LVVAGLALAAGLAWLVLRTRKGGGKVDAPSVPDVYSFLPETPTGMDPLPVPEGVYHWMLEGFEQAAMLVETGRTAARKLRQKRERQPWWRRWE